MSPPAPSNASARHDRTPAPRVSVLLPCYNAALTLNEAIESIAAQTLTDFELVAVDDGSSDATVALPETWAERDPRVRLHRRPHTGIVEALNAGLADCRAPWVARMDADDRAHPQRLEKQVAYLAAHAEIAVVGCLVEGFPADEVRQGFRIYIEWLNSLVARMRSPERSGSRALWRIPRW